MLKSTGIPTEKDLESVIPSKERLSKGPVAIMECFEKIPCNPCTSCKRGAIKEFEDINDRPQLDVDICNGCGVCISNCPGLAIFVVDETYSETEALVKISYEFLPLPEEGTFVTGLDRAGKPVCRAKVVKVQNTKAQDRTPVVSLAVPKEFSMVVRCLSLDDYYSGSYHHLPLRRGYAGRNKGTLGKGYQTVDEIKRISRCGMGPCQGRTCAAYPGGNCKGHRAKRGRPEGAHP